MWHGTNPKGKPFELVGTSLLDFDEQGRLTHEFVTYPHADEYVDEAVDGDGTPATGSLTTQDALPARLTRPAALGPSCQHGGSCGCP